MANDTLHDLTERVKELTCLYEMTQIMEKFHNIVEVFSEIVKILPKAWQYPEQCAARIEFEGQTYKSPNFIETAWIQVSKIYIAGEEKGFVEIAYLKEFPNVFEGPFLKEERSLLDNIADQLARFIVNMRAEDKFRQIRELVSTSMRPNLTGQPIPQKLENERDKELLMNFLDAIANRERFQLLDMIRKQPLCVSDIAEKMGKSHSTISHHLKYLEGMNVIKGWKSGKFTYFSLIQTQIQKFLEIFEIWLGTSTNWLKTT